MCYCFLMSETVVKQVWEGKSIWGATVKVSIYKDGHFNLSIQYPGEDAVYDVELSAETAYDAAVALMQGGC